MGKFSVSDSKEQALLRTMAQLKIEEEDLLEKFIRGSGHGGQKINKTSSCVYLKHIPSGIEVKTQRTRSQSLNRYYARVELCEKILDNIEGEKSKRQREIAKIRRQKNRRSRKSKEKILADKQNRSTIKINRQKIKGEDS